MDKNTQGVSHETAPDGLEEHKSIFQTVSITSAAAIAILIGFLGDTWGNLQASKITIDALINLLPSLVPTAVLLFFMWSHGGHNSLLKRKRSRINQVIPLLSLAIFLYTGVVILTWLYRLSEIVAVTNPVPPS